MIKIRFISEVLVKFCSMHRATSASLSHVLTSSEVKLDQQLIRLSLFNLFLVSVMGLILRSYPFVSLPFQYRNFLHAHSHFAFGGWIMPMLAWMIRKYFPELRRTIPFKHWRSIVMIILLSAYGMLASFPFQGYGTVSIIFSTLSIIGGVYLSYWIWRALRQQQRTISQKILQAGIFYLVLSSIGPFATGPIGVMVGTQSSLFANAIYFFLHFQYNGFFTLVTLAVLCRILESHNALTRGNRIFWSFHLACIPTFFLSTLWNHPGIVFNIIGGAGATLQMAGTYWLVKDFSRLKYIDRFVKSILDVALFTLCLKVTLQLMSGIPFIADLAYQHRNFIIAYLHTVLLGFISLFSFVFILHSNSAWVVRFKPGIKLFIFSLVTTNGLLVMEALGECYHFYIPSFSILLLIATLFFPLSIWIMISNLKKKASLERLARI